MLLVGWFEWGGGEWRGREAGRGREREGEGDRGREKERKRTGREGGEE